jgi:hypothetical protein
MAYLYAYLSDVDGLKWLIGVLGHKEHVYDIKMGTLSLPEKLSFTNLVTSGNNFDPTIEAVRPT